MNRALLVIGMLVSGFSFLHIVDDKVFVSEDRLPVDFDHKSVYKADLEEARVQAIYTSEFSVRDIRPSAGGDRIVVHAIDFSSGYTEVDIISEEGELLKKFENAVTALFIDRAGRRVMLTKGYVDVELRQASRGTWLYDFDSGEEQRVADRGLYLELATFNQSVYIREGEGSKALRYDIGSGRVESAHLDYGGSSPKGTYRWRYKTTGGVEIVRRETGDEISSNFELLKSRRHGTPLYWMTDEIVMVPHYRKELEEYLLFVESGKTLRVPGRVLTLSRDEKYVHVCTPGLVLDKLPLSNLEVLYEGVQDASQD